MAKTATDPGIVTRKFKHIELRFAAVTVGFLKRNEALMEIVNNPRRTLPDTLKAMAFVHGSCYAAADPHTSDEIDDSLMMDEMGPAIQAALEAAGFTFSPVAPGEADPAKL